MQTTRADSTRGIERRRATGLPSFVLLCAVELFAAWTLAYHAVLPLRAAAWLTLPLAAALSVALHLLRRGLHPVERRTALISSGTAVALLVLSLAAAAFSLVVARPDADDFDVFHRGLVQASRLSRPFEMGNTALDEPGLPAISPLHTATAYEPLAAILSSVVGLDPLWVYQNAMGALAAALLPFVYFFLYRELRLSPGAALAGVCGVMAFLLVDGNVHRSFGNMSFVRLWQGKAVFWTLGIPLSWLLGLRFMRRPTPGRWLDLALLGVCAVGLTNSGVYLFPVGLLVLAAAGLALGPSATRLQQAVLLTVAAAYPAIVAGLVLTGIVRAPADLRFFSDGWPATWWTNLALVVDSRWTLVRDLVLLVALPLTCLRRRGATILVGMTAMMCVAVTNPVVGPAWLRAVLPSSYWRFAYLFPVPLAAGLIPCALVRIRAASRPRALAGALAGLVTVALSLTTTTLAKDNGTFFKKVTDYKLAPDVQACVAPVLQALDRHNVLAPERVVVVLGLLEPGVRFDAVRSAVTLGAFQNAHRELEGQRRLAAQRWVTTGREDPATRAAVSESLQQRVNAVVTTRALLPDIGRRVQQQWGRFDEIAGGGECVALVRSAGPAAQRSR